MVRVSLRNGLPKDYSGPVELQDLRLAISPWRWAAAELGTSLRTKALNQALSEAQAVNAAEPLHDVPAVVQWLADELDAAEVGWERFPDDIDFWEDCGVLKLMRETNMGTFIPLDLEFNAVYFFSGSSSADASLRLVVAQTWFDAGSHLEWGPVGIYTCSQLIADTTTNPLDWLFTSDTVVLADPVTGAHAFLMPGAFNELDEEGTEGLMPPIGFEPALAVEQPVLLAPAQRLSCAEGQLYYRSGQLYPSVDAMHALTIELRLPAK
jgi:hypothetical protein